MNQNVFNQLPGPIGIFDSGYGGLTILEKIREQLPNYDYIYLGDNARTPYGTRSFEVVYQYTLECVTALFEMGCHLVILACNTASAKALRTIQQKDLPLMDPGRRVLGVIRPTVESLNRNDFPKHVGILATPGTVQSNSYPLEINHIHTDIRVSSWACPLWVPLIENKEIEGPGTEYFVRRDLEQLLIQDPDIEEIILGCTHYPLLTTVIRKFLPENIKLIDQGEIVAKSLSKYLSRHPEMNAKCTKNGACTFYTTESPEKFNNSASIFIKTAINAKQIRI